MKRTRQRAFTLAESMLAIFLIGLAMSFLALLFKRSFEIMRIIDESEVARQAGRMGYDRLASELREATNLDTEPSVDQVRFEKINPEASAVEPPLADDDPGPNWEPPVWTPEMTYPASSRLQVRYFMKDEAIYRTVTSLGKSNTQLVVKGINSFVCTPNKKNKGEVEIAISVKDNRRVVTVSGRILCPCVKEKFGEG